MKARIIQYRFGPEPGDLEANFRWILSELDACGPGYPGLRDEVGVPRKL